MPTSPGGIRYPSTGGHTDLALYFQQLTEDIDQRVRISVADETARLALAAPVEGLEVYEKATKRIYVRTSTGWQYVWGPPGSPISGGISGGSSNWTVTTSTRQQLGNGFAFLSIIADRKNSTLAVDAGGNFPNSDVCTVPADWAPLTPFAGLSTLGTGRMVMGYVESSGIVRLATTTSGPDIEVGDTIELAGVYMLANPAAAL